MNMFFKRFQLMLCCLLLGGNMALMQAEETSSYLSVIQTTFLNSLDITEIADFSYHLVVTGEDPYVALSPLQQGLSKDQTVIAFEYKAPSAMRNMEFFFSWHGSFVGGHELSWNINVTEDWTTAYIDLTSSINSFGWGAIGDFLRLDLTNTIGLSMDIRNIRFVTQQEYDNAMENLEYDPIVPDEPGVIQICRLSVSADPAEGAYVNGGGRYQVTGSSVYVSTSSRNNDDFTYIFQYWTLDGERYNSNSGFWYTPTPGNHVLVAHYTKKEVEYDPDSPSEPSSAQIKHKYYLYLSPTIDGACTFNCSSGVKREENSTVYLCAYYNSQEYRFDGWRVNGSIISTQNGFNYTMPSAETIVEAMFTELEYDPDIPMEPSSVIANILGDVDMSGKANLTDLKILSELITAKRTKTDNLNMTAADVNDDGKIDILDVTKLVEMLNK